jgi:hypothetical protein
VRLAAGKGFTLQRALEASREAWKKGTRAPLLGCYEVRAFADRRVLNRDVQQSGSGLGLGLEQQPVDRVPTMVSGRAILLRGSSSSETSTASSLTATTASSCVNLARPTSLFVTGRNRESPRPIEAWTLPDSRGVASRRAPHGRDQTPLWRRLSRRHFACPAARPRNQRAMSVSEGIACA